MGIVQIINVIVMIVRYAPQAIGIIKELLQMLNVLKNDPTLNNKEVLKEFQEGLRELQDKKDVSRLVALHKRITGL
jgi:hypothetical protein